MTTKTATDVRTQTLAEFSAQVDDFLGHPAGFEQSVRGLWITRRQIDELDTARRLIFAQIKVHYEQGQTVVEGTGLELRRTAPGEPETYQAVPSEVIKRADKAAWERAKAPVPWVAIKAPSAAAVPELDVKPPTLRQRAGLREAVAAYRDHPAWEVLKGLRAQETELVEHLDKLGANAGWDGLPITFSDGWTAGLRRLQYSSERLREIDPALFDRLAVVKTRQAPARVYVAKIGVAGEATELDAE